MEFIVRIRISEITRHPFQVARALMKVVDKLLDQDDWELLESSVEMIPFPQDPTRKIGTYAVYTISDQIGQVLNLSGGSSQKEGIDADAP